MTQKKVNNIEFGGFSFYFFPNGNVLKVVPILALQNESKDARFFDDMRPRVSLVPIVSLFQLPQRNLGIGPKFNIFFFAEYSVISVSPFQCFYASSNCPL